MDLDFEPHDVYVRESSYIPRKFTSKVIKSDGVSNTQWNRGGALRFKAWGYNFKKKTTKLFYIMKTF